MSRLHFNLVGDGMPKTFRARHFVAWLCYLLVMKWSIEFLSDVQASSGLTLILAIATGWAALCIAGYFIEHWLDGANRYTWFRIALVLSALASCGVGLWLLWHHLVLLLVGLLTLFQRPLELVSLTLFLERLGIMSLAVATVALFSWMSYRVARVLLSGEQQANIEQVLDNESFGGEALVPALPAESMAPHSRMADGHAPAAGGARPASPEPSAGTAPIPPAPDLHTLAYEGHADPARAAQCRTLGWPAFEQVLRTEPGMPELADAIAALPHLAATLDADEAARVRDWLGRLADHPGAYEIELARSQITDPYVRTQVIRIADVALQSLVHWDEVRAGLQPEQAPIAPAA